MKTNPAIIVTSITALITAACTLIVAFGTGMTPDQKQAIIGVGAALSAVIAALGPIIAQVVVSPQTAANAVVMAKQDTSGTNEVPAINMTGSSYNDAVKDMGHGPHAAGGQLTV